ncbi:hypothetical protein TNCV_4952601 [Trichonephila clavipes]|nr:hypothetical protein TNCV_4952601 [Trichonephila clavipes]
MSQKSRVTFLKDVQLYEPIQYSTGLDHKITISVRVHFHYIRDDIGSVVLCIKGTGQESVFAPNLDVLEIPSQPDIPVTRSLL